MNDTSKDDKKTSMATASIICSVLSVVPLLGFVFGTAGLIFGVIALRRRYKYPDIYGGEIRAILSLLLWAAFMIAWIWALVYHPETLLGST